MRRRGYFSDQSGVSSVEFALILPLLLALIFTLIDFGRIGFVEIGLAAASREGVRYSSLNSSGVPNLAAFASYIQNSAPNVAQVAQLQSSSQLTISLEPCSTSVPNENTKLTVSTDFKWLLPTNLINLAAGNSSLTNNLNLSSTSQMRCMN